MSSANHRGIEWPTVMLAVAVYGGWLALTAWANAVPLPLLAALGGWFVAWHGSLQHETIHGHPTRHRAVNDLIGGVPLSLWLPYGVYRRTHRAHHASPAPTHPDHDPELRYVGAGTGWRARATLDGQLLIGPVASIALFLSDEARRMARQPAAAAHEWLPHLAGAVLDGTADVAAIDEVTFAAIARFEPALAGALRIVDHSAPAATPAFVTAAGTPVATVAALRVALATALDDPGLAHPRALLGLAGLHPTHPDLARRIGAQDAAARAAGYPVLA